MLTKPIERTPERSPEPWGVYQPVDPRNKYGYSIVSSSFVIASGLSKMDAEYIVAAVAAFKPMVEFLTAIKTMLPQAKYTKTINEIDTFLYSLNGHKNGEKI